MRTKNGVLPGSVGLLTISLIPLPGLLPVALAQIPETSQRAAIEEIVVTARRKAESLQEVPSSINVVTAAAIDDLKLTEFTDLESLVPGLTLAQDGSGTQTSASLRGVTFDARSTAPSTVAMYLNDAPVQSLFLYDSLFDVGQIEVLRGPQGTVRGVSAPSGAITVTSRKADPTASGGFIKGVFTDRDGQNYQAGVNIPLWPERLAVRLSGVSDATDANGVKSIRNGDDPEQKTRAGRFSLLFEPSDDLSMEMSYSHIDKRLHSFEQVSGPGQGTSPSPSLAPERRRSLQDQISDVDVDLDVVTARIEKQVANHTLTYVGSYQEAGTSEWTDNDKGGVLPGVAIPFATTSAKSEVTHEIRFASLPASAGGFEYTVGLFYDEADTSADIVNPGPLLPGAFGTPAGAPSLSAFDPRYQLPVLVNIDYLSKETSLFASGTWHLSDRTELTAGVRQIWSEFSSSQGISLGDGLVPMPPGMIGGGLPDCASAQLPSTYPGFCDITIPGSAFPTTRFHAKEEPLIYNVSLSYMATDDLMIYGATGTAYRPPIASPGIQGDLAGNPDPRLNTLTYHPKEMSTNYEVGFKWSSADRLARLNAAAFYQEFEDFTMLVPYVYYLNTATGQPAVADFTASVDAVVSGFEVDGAISVGRFDLSAQLSYANGDVDGSSVPCNVFENGAPVFNTAGLISRCPGGSASLDPLWGATVQGDYSLPVSDRMELYGRVLFSYTAENNNRHAGFVVDDYVITNLYFGARNPDGGWEVAGFVRNLFDTEEAVDVSPNAYEINGSLGLSFPGLIPAGGSGYYRTEMTPPREVGISIQYAWGSR